MSAATVSFTNILTSTFGSDYTQVWPNTLRADAAIVFLSKFYLDNTIETTDPNDFACVGEQKFLRRFWSDMYHVRQQNEISLEMQFVQMFDELCVFLLAQTSDDLAMMTLRTAIRHHRFSLATDICKTTQWSNVAARLFPIMKNSKY